MSAPGDRNFVATSFATSIDGARIAYDRIGNGPPLVLLHGGYIQDRGAWQRHGYLQRLENAFSIFALDLRGHGASDRPGVVDAYRAELFCADVAAVLDAEHIDRAPVWGFSLGAGVALQLACFSERVTRIAVGGAILGRWLTEEAADKMAEGMESLNRAKRGGALHVLPIPDAQKVFAQTANLEVAAIVTRALARWPVIEPEALACPAFFYAGSEDAAGIATIRRVESQLAAREARCAILDGLDHMGAFAAVDTAIEACRGFLELT